MMRASITHTPGRRSLQAWELRSRCRQAATGVLDRLCRAGTEEEDKKEQRGRARLQEQVGEDGDDLRVEQARRPKAGALRAAQAVRRAPDAHAHLRPLAREARGHAREAAAAAELRLPAPAAPRGAPPVKARPVCVPVLNQKLGCQTTPACLCNREAHAPVKVRPTLQLPHQDARALTHAQQHRRSCLGRPQLACAPQCLYPTGTARARTCTRTGWQPSCSCHKESL